MLARLTGLPGAVTVTEAVVQLCVLHLIPASRSSPSARWGKSGKREIIGGQRPESRWEGGLLNRGAQGAQAGLVPA